MRTRLLRVFLDANVMVDAQVRDLVLRAAEARLIDVRWSSEVLDETGRALIDRLGLPAPSVVTLLRAVTRAFPDAIVDGYEPLVGAFRLPDPDDRHVLAAAVRGECDILLTENLKDFPVDLLPASADLLVCTIDDGIRLLAESYPAAIAAVVRDQVAALRRPPTRVGAFVDRLSARAPIGAMAVGAALGLPAYEEQYAQVTASEEPDGS